MARVLYLLTGSNSDLALTTITQQLQAGDHVTVALFDQAATPVLPSGVTVHRVPTELTYPELLDRLFEADQVITW